MDTRRGPAMSDLRKKQIGGDHYLQMGLQPWDVLQSWMTNEEFSAFLRGNVIKYLARQKNGLEDLKKARHVLDKLIEVQETAALTVVDEHHEYWHAKKIREDR